MGYDWSVDDLERMAAVPAGDCPFGEEGEWLYILESAALEGELRLRHGHHSSGRAADLASIVDRLKRRCRTMRQVTAAREEANLS